MSLPSRWKLALALSLVASGALAQVSPTERALARELFEQGRELLAREQYSEACAKLAESQRLDPAPGTLLNLAVCHEAEGKTASAWSEFNDALTLARRDGRQDRVELASRRLEELEPLLSRLTLEVSGESRIPGLALRLDGASVGEAAWGAAVPVDPGSHVIEATAPGRRAWRREIAVGPNADRQVVQVPLLEPLPPTREPRRAAPPPPDRPEPRPERTDDGSGQRTAGLVIGGLGIAAIGVGGYFGLRAFSRWEDRNAHCSDAGCDPEGVRAGEDAERAAIIANVGIGVGLAAAGIGSYLLLSAGSGQEQATLLRYGGRF
jgi:hypothetical protein